MAIKTFRGLLADGGQDTIRLRTNNGLTGYRIVKFQVIGPRPSTNTQESTVKIYTVPQTSVDDKIDLGDNDLLAVAYIESYAASTSNEPEVIIFDNTVFNQDIYITHEDANNAAGCNYYIELEQVKLSDIESTMVTLQSIRSRYESYTPAGPT